jgi:acyl-CoA synthetase (AMP-forming)/AMP-acid ligase II
VPPGDHERKVGSVGVLVPNMEARLVNELDESVSEGEPGELWLRGPNVMKVSFVICKSVRSAYDA